MEPELKRSRELVLATARSELGTWWPNPWWPTGKSDHNDCMAFVSWALYGLDGNQPYYAWVPSIMERAIREGRWKGVTERDGRRGDWAATRDIQAGDIVVLDWYFRDSRDHVVIATGPILYGVLPCIQTNNGGGGTGGGSDSVRLIGYPERFILGRYRPPYPASVPASPSPAKPLPVQHNPLGDHMPVIYVIDGNTVYAWDTATGVKRKLNATEWRIVRGAYAAAGLKVPVTNWPK